MSTQPTKSFRLVRKRTISNAGDTSLPINFYGVGFDVHKYKINMCLSAQLIDGSIIEVKQHVFSSSPSGTVELLNFLRKYVPIKCMLMECTGVYHIALYQALTREYSNTETEIIAMNPLLLNRKLTDLGHHSDKADAKGLASLSFYRKLLRASYIGTNEFFLLRDTMRSFHKTQSQISQNRNRIYRLLSLVNFKGPLNLKAEWCLKLLDWWLGHDLTFMEAYNSYISYLKDNNRPTKVLEKHQKEFLAYSDVSLDKRHRFLLQMHLGRLLYVETIAATYLRRTEQLILQNEEFCMNYQKLLEIPGFAAVTAMTVLVELGDFYRFKSWKAMIKFCGLTPQIHDSGLSTSRGHINRYSNKYLRRVLSQAAAIIVNRPNKDYDLGKFAYQQKYVKHLPFKKAIIKVGQKMARTVYSILVLNIDYNPTYETAIRAKRARDRRLNRKGTLMESSRTRSLRRNVQDFIVSNYEFTNSTSRYHLKSGFNRMIQKARWVDQQDLATEDSREKKKKKIISK